LKGRVKTARTNPKYTRERGKEERKMKMERILVESESIIVTDQFNTFASPTEEIVTSQG